MTDKRKGAFVKGKFEDGLGDTVFVRSVDDNKPGMSMDDRRFIDIMNHSLTRSKLGHWEASLPLSKETMVLRDNQKDALRRLKSNRRTLDKKPLPWRKIGNFLNRIERETKTKPSYETMASDQEI